MTAHEEAIHQSVKDFLHGMFRLASTLGLNEHVVIGAIGDVLTVKRIRSQTEEIERERAKCLKSQK